MRFIGANPDGVTLDVLRYVGNLLGQDVCWFLRGAFHFKLGNEWTVAISPESAGRFRVDTCHLTAARATKWCRAADRSRLESLIREAADTSFLMNPSL